MLIYDQCTKEQASLITKLSLSNPNHHLKSPILIQICGDEQILLIHSDDLLASRRHKCFQSGTLGKACKTDSIELEHYLV